MAELFQKSRPTIVEHLKNIFESGELDENSVCRKFRQTAEDGKNYQTQFYNLKLVVAVGYRVNSECTRHCGLDPQSPEERRNAA
jgi:hypothetical protein